jgi:Dolichyl-phosphate-mannose-protein mannosyltransferase
MTCPPLCGTHHSCGINGALCAYSTRSCSFRRLAPCTDHQQADTSDGGHFTGADGGPRAGASSVGWKALEVITTATGRPPSSPSDSPVVDVGSTRDTTRSSTRRRRISWPIVGVLVALMAVSSVAHLWALHRDLPIPDTDERVFVRPAVHMAATADLNPHWFGHPGSTVIYPLAGFFHVWDAVAHRGPLVTSNPTLTERFQRSPEAFYVIGRLWTIVLSVGALPLLFLVGRRAFNTRVALIATAVWAVLPLPVHFGRMVRTDSAGVFFGLLSLWLCLRLLDQPRARWCVLAGVSVGLAISSRYFLVALVPVLLAAAVLPRRRTVRPALRSAGAALASAAAAFVLTTPFFFLDWHAAMESLRNENLPLFEHEGLSPLGNLRWYLGTAIPEALTWPLFALAAAGVVMALRRRRVGQLLLVAFCVIFLAGICVSELHQHHWVIQILPVLALFAATALDTIVHRLAAAIPRVARTSILAPAAVVAITGLLLIAPVAKLVDANANPTTRLAAGSWIQGHLPAESRIVEDARNVPLDHTKFRVDYHFGTAGDQRPDPPVRTVAEYRRAGYEYLIVNTSWIAYSTFSPNRFPDATVFYEDVACLTRLIAVFDHDSLRHGPTIRIYKIQDSPTRTFGPRCDQHPAIRV